MLRKKPKKYTCHFCDKKINKAYKCKNCGKITCKDCATLGNSLVGKVFRRGLALGSAGVSDWVMSQCPACDRRSMKTV